MPKILKKVALGNTIFRLNASFRKIKKQYKNDTKKGVHVFFLMWNLTDQHYRIIDHTIIAIYFLVHTEICIII